MRKLLLTALALALAFQVPVSAQAPPRGSAADLATGIRQVEEGDLEAATITLEGVIKSLKQDKGREQDVATAHLYLAMAHLGLSQWERAKGDMLEAWRNNKGLALDPKKFPPRVIQLYDEASKEAKQTGAAAPPRTVAPPVPQPTPAPAVTAKKGGAKTPLLIGLGVAAAAGIGVGVAGGGGKGAASTPAPTPVPTPVPNRPPVVTTVNYSASGTGLMGVTNFSFAATASDPDYDPLTFRWDFGDGASATGQTCEHIFQREGPFTVVATAADGRGGEGSASALVAVRSVTGMWTCDVMGLMEWIQTSRSVIFRGGQGNMGNFANGRLDPPAILSMDVQEYSNPSSAGRYSGSFNGELNFVRVGLEGGNYSIDCRRQ